MILKWQDEYIFLMRQQEMLNAVKMFLDIGGKCFEEGKHLRVNV